jgi:putative hemolysin
MNSSSESLYREVLFIVSLIILYSIFSASEMALVALNKNRLNQLSEEGDEKAKLILELLKEPSSLIFSIRIGMTTVGFLASAFVGHSLAKRLSKIFWEINTPAKEYFSILIATVSLSYFILLLGDLFSKRIGVQNSHRIAMLVIKPMLLFCKITSPYARLLTASLNVLVRLFGLNLNNLEEKVSEEEIRMLIDVGEENGIINETEREMLDGIFEFNDTLAREIMTPRTSVFAVDINSNKDELIDNILEEQYSRIPIYEEDRDNIIGILYMKDLFSHIRKGDIKDIEIRSMLRPPYFVPETKNIDTLFKELQSTKNHMALLIDEYGGFAGIVTIEDVIEEVMGNIFDEHDINEDEIEQLDNYTYVVNGLTAIDEVNEKLDVSIPSDYFDTIGGFVVSLLGTIPREEEKSIIEFENLKFKIEKVNEKRIESLRIIVNR